MLLSPLSLRRTEWWCAAGQWRCGSVNRLQVYNLDRMHEAMVRTGPVLVLGALSTVRTRTSLIDDIYGACTTVCRARAQVLYYISMFQKSWFQNIRAEYNVSG